MLEMREQLAVSDPIRVFYGFDQRQAMGSYVFLHSMHRQASAPVEAQPIMLSQLRHEYWRDRDRAATESALARFLVPYLCGYRGWALFAEGVDMLCRGDIAELWALRDYRYAVQVVKHVHAGASRTGPEFEAPWGDWTSVMMLNCEKCRALTPKYANEATVEELHRFRWLDDQGQIGGLPGKWNHRVGMDPPAPDAGLVRWINGSPFLNRHTEFADEWLDALRAMTHMDQSPGLKAVVTGQ